MKRILYIILLSSLLFSDDYSVVNLERFEVTLRSDKDGNVNPRVTIPINWSKNYYSGIGYEAKSTIAHSDFGSDAAPSKYVTSANGKYLWIDIIGSKLKYKNSHFSYSFTLGHRTVDIVQYGYFHFTDTLTDKKETVAVDRSTELETYNVGFYLDYSHKNIADFLSLRISTYVYPYSYLTADESFAIMPWVEKEGEAKSTQTQDISYNLNLNMVLDISKFIDLGFSAKYEYLPFKFYSLNTTVKGSGFAFEPEKYQNNSTATSFGVRLLFSNSLFSGITPMIGYEQSKISDETIFAGSTSTKELNEESYIFGLEKMF